MNEREPIRWTPRAYRLAELARRVSIPLGAVAALALGMATADLNWWG